MTPPPAALVALHRERQGRGADRDDACCWCGHCESEDVRRCECCRRDVPACVASWDGSDICDECHATRAEHWHLAPQRWPVQL